MKIKHFSKRTLVRILSYTLAGFFILAGFTYAGWREAYVYRRFIEYSYQKSFYDVVSGMSEVDSALQKGTYARSGTMVSQLAAEITRSATNAQSALSQLPFSFQELENTSGFLSRVSDYSNVLARKAASGQELIAEDAENIKTLAASAKDLAGQLMNLQSIINEENLRIGSVLKAEAQVSEEQGTALFAGTFKDMESIFNSTPTLIYDGPYSQHLDERTAKMLEDAPEVSLEQAQRIALEQLGLSDGQVTFSRENQGRVPTYTFTGHLDGGELSVDITKKGGYILLLSNSRTPTENVLSPEQSISKAEEFLKKIGYESMKMSYWIDTGTSIVINFAYNQSQNSDIICYPDLVKVGIARDTGEVVQLEALGYLMNHAEHRDIKEPAVTMEAAEKHISKDLTLVSSRLCIIPSRGEHEILCYELTCVTPDDVHVILYINTETGMEENILILIEDENGTLVT